jgi:hypothetical protein
MFTIEMDHDETRVTILDENDHYEDVQFVIFDDIVYIRQWSEELDLFETIAMSPEMFDEFRKALDLPEGAYRTK